MNSHEEVLNKCPLCGAELEYVELNQYSNVYRILKNGKVSKTRKFKRYEGPMECGFISCNSCDFHTNCDLECEENHNIKIYQENGVYMYDER